MRIGARETPGWVIATAIGGVVLAGLWMMSTGVYGLGLFVLVPVLIGGFGALLRGSAATESKCAWTGVVAVLLASLAPLLFAWEGIICTAMALPLTLPLGALGGWLAWTIRNSRVPGNSTTAFLLLLPLSAGTLGFDLTAKPPVYIVRTSVEVAAAPEQVWKHMVSFPEMPKPEEWYFKSGIAYPERVSIEGSGVGAARACDFSTGPFTETITIWDEPRVLRFTTKSSPAPMREWGLYGDVEAKHLHGYFRSRQGEFRLTPLPNGRTRLEGTSWYQHGLWPAQYWRLWSDAIIRRVHLRVLNHIKNLAEQDSPAAVAALQRP